MQKEWDKEESFFCLFIVGRERETPESVDVLARGTCLKMMSSMRYVRRGCGIAVICGPLSANIRGRGEVVVFTKRCRSSCQMFQIGYPFDQGGVGPLWSSNYFKSKLNQRPVGSGLNSMCTLCAAHLLTSNY